MVRYNLPIHLSIVNLYPAFSLYSIVFFINQKQWPSWLRAEALGIFFWPKGSFYFKIVRWFGALGTPHTIKALWEGDRTLFVRGLSPAPFGGCLVLFDFALRATFQVFVVIGEILLYLSSEELMFEAISWLAMCSASKKYSTYFI